MYGRRMTRDWYQPSASLEATMETVESVPGSEIYRYSLNGFPVAMVFGGKRAKPDWNFRFKNAEKMEAKIEQWIEREVANDQSRKEARVVRNSGHTLKVGDVLHASWGYEQTNATFYQIVGVPSKCFVMAREIGYTTVRENGSMTYVVPVKDSFKDDEAKRFKASPGNAIRIESYMHMSKTEWDEEHYVTHWAYGH